MRRKNLTYFYRIIVICLICLLVLKFYFDVELKRKNSFENKQNQNLIETPTIKFVKTFKLNEKLLPEDVYSQIVCVNSTKIEVITLICIHELNKDTWVSRDIFEQGVWEKRTVGRYSFCLFI
jgi:uncharacterized protein YpmB